MISMVRIRKLITILFCLIFMFAHLIYAAETDGVQYYYDNQKLNVFIPQNGSGNVNSVQAQIGNKVVVDAEVMNISASPDCHIHTIILFDNSNSISAANRDKMKAAAKDVVNKHATGEMFTFITFDWQMHELMYKTTDYSSLLQMIDSIQYINQPTYLKDILYNAIFKYGSDENLYIKFVVLSDGTDDNDVGYTYEEIKSLFKGKNFRIYTVGSRYEANIGALEEMFSISRATNTDYFLLDEMDDVNVIGNKVAEGNPVAIAGIELPVEVQDGSSKNIKLSVTTDSGNYEVIASAAMPFVDTSVFETEPETETESETEPETETETETEIETEPEIEPEPEPEPETEPETESIGFLESDSLIHGFKNLYLLIVVIIIVIIIVLAVYLNMKRKKTEPPADSKKDDSNEVEDAVESDATVLLSKNNNRADYEDDDKTVLWENQGQLIITLIPEGDYARKIERVFKGEISIGRKKDCDISINDDKSVSGIHCMIYKNDMGELCVRDNNSSNGTYLNDEKIFTEQRIEDGDTLEIGRLRYIVKITFD